MYNICFHLGIKCRYKKRERIDFVADKPVFFKIIIPIVFVCILASLWYFKTAKTETASAGIVPVNEPINMEELKARGLPIMIEFSSATCPVCKLMLPTLSEIKGETEGKLTFVYVDLSKNPSFAKDFPVRATPTRLFYNADGSPFTPSESLLEKQNFLIYSHRETKEHLFTAQEGENTKECLWEMMIF